MARSKIIKDLANGEVDTMTALKRTKVLLSELKNEELSNWVDHEISGYPQDAPLPDYRKARGQLFGSYIKGSMAVHMKYTNVSLPLGQMPDELRDEFLAVHFREGVEALKKLLESIRGDENAELGKNIPADFFPAIAKYNNDPYMVINSARVVVGIQYLQNVFSTIENKLLDVLITLEREFGNLDELDIDVSGRTTEELDSLCKKIHLLIYNDYSIKIGDDNTIKNSSVAT